jgi:hypothetical protein
MAPIGSAPVKPGEYFGPCLLSPGLDNEWTIGRWNGDGWFSDDGFPLSPTVWALLSVTVAAGPR